MQIVVEIHGELERALQQAADRLHLSAQTLATAAFRDLLQRMTVRESVPPAKTAGGRPPPGPSA